ncbi:MAG: alanyl-tRNA editing protein, partial [Anaerolineae bacterium]
MTHLLYQTDSYLRSFEAHVTTSGEDGVILDQTAFYPGGGGQPHDIGRLFSENGRQWQVTGIARREGQIWHLLAGDSPAPAKGTPVRGELDWERRYQLMRTHTALHILCGVIWRDYGVLVTGGNMEPLRARMDFEFESMEKSLVQEIERAVNQEVAAAHPIRVRILPREEAFQIPDLIRTKVNLLPPAITEVRVVEIVGLDMQADGGTHVANTREVGRMHVVDYMSKGKSNKRMIIA